MREIKPNDILVNKEGRELTVLAIHGDSVWTIDGEMPPWTHSIPDLIRFGWTKKKTPWVPENEKDYFVADITCKRLNYALEWSGSSEHLHRLALGLVFETEAEAVAKAKEIIKLMGK